MLSFERTVVATLVGSGPDAARRAAIEEYVDDCLRAMPEHLRLGVAVESVALGAWARLMGRGTGERLDRTLAGWRTSPLDPIRQYVRMFESLVVFAVFELDAERSS